MWLAVIVAVLILAFIFRNRIKSITISAGPVRAEVKINETNSETKKEKERDLEE